MENPRRNPKRKVAEVADASDVAPESPEDLLGKSCSPLTQQEIEDWQGWVELESEPAFFNAIIRDLGVKDVKIQELFSVDQASLGAVSKPLFGLIFLFQYEPGQEGEDKQHDADNQVWFANQTTNNACATVALLNIVMNAPEIDLGEQLTDFKEATKEIDTSLRGHRISSNSFIRTIHNSFTRRMDHLNADLCLRNDFDDANSNAKKKNSSRKFPARGSGRKRPAYEYGYHFIAYVFSNGYVWELDGLRTNPYKLGPSDEKDWTAVARPQIEARMLQYEGSQLSFNLLAVCRSTLPHLSQTITIMLAAIRLIQTRMKGDTVFNDIVCADEQLLDVHNQTQLAEFHIHLSEVESAEVPMELKSALSRLHWPVEEAYEMYQRFRAKLKAAMDEFRFELMFTEEDERRVRGRKRDYGGALHCWVKKLAEKGVLADIIRMSS